MPATTTIWVDLERLNYSAASASVIIRLMMACNDIALANQCLGKHKEEYLITRNHAEWGSAMYFIRLQCGHLTEAMTLIEEIKEDSNLASRVNNCPEFAKNSFKKLERCLKGGPDNGKFEDYVGRIRNNTVFHYDPKLVSRSLADRASRAESRRSTITKGDDISLWRFGVADDILDSIVCREIWKIPPNADLREEANQYVDFGSDLCKAFLDFCGEFIWRYVRA